jgi:hypothetical protein
MRCLAGAAQSTRSAARRRNNKQDGAATPLEPMKLLSRIVLITLAALIIGGAVFLASWDIPAPSAPVERVIPNDKVLR